jgi:putative transposase
MTRPLRVEINGALYHVTARGDRRDWIYRSDSDRLTWLSMLGEACKRFNITVHAYCQMGNHYHILLETVDGNLSRAMRDLNGNYAQYFNRTHGTIGHLFQGRFKAILCQHETYLQELARYIELNPVRAGVVHRPADWPWSSYGATMGVVDAPKWLRFEAVLQHFGDELTTARQTYAEFVAAGIGGRSPLAEVSNQLILGDQDFKARIVGTKANGNPFEIKRVQRRAVARPLPEYFAEYRDRKEAMARAYRSLGYSMPEIAAYARVSLKTVSRAIKAFEEKETGS